MKIKRSEIIARALEGFAYDASITAMSYYLGPNAMKPDKSPYENCLSDMECGRYENWFNGTISESKKISSVFLPRQD